MRQQNPNSTDHLYNKLRDKVSATSSKDKQMWTNKQEAKDPSVFSMLWRKSRKAKDPLTWPENRRAPIINRHTLESAGATVRTWLPRSGSGHSKPEEFWALWSSLQGLVKSRLCELSGHTCQGTLSEKGPTMTRNQSMGLHLEQSMDPRDERKMKSYKVGKGHNAS